MPPENGTAFLEFTYRLCALKSTLMSLRDGTMDNPTGTHPTLLDKDVLDLGLTDRMVDEGREKGLIIETSRGGVFVAEHMFDAR